MRKAAPDARERAFRTAPYTSKRQLPRARDDTVFLARQEAHGTDSPARGPSRAAGTTRRGAGGSPVACPARQGRRSATRRDRPVRAGRRTRAPLRRRRLPLVRGLAPAADGLALALVAGALEELLLLVLAHLLAPLLDDAAHELLRAVRSACARDLRDPSREVNLTRCWLAPRCRAAGERSRASG